MTALLAAQTAADAARLALLEAENRKLRKINKVLMDRVERAFDTQADNGFSLFQTAITLESKVSQRTAELSALTQTLRREIFERREAEAALRIAKAEAEQANLSKTRFLLAASHDLHQPLNAARLFLGALADEVSGERARELIERVESALELVDDLLSALLDISRLDAGVWPVQPESFPLAPLLARLAREYRPQAQALGLAMRVVPSSLVVHTDRRLLERVMRNLISNAIRYTGSGRILVGCRRGGGCGPAGGGRYRHRHCRGETADDFRGIPPARQQSAARRQGRGAGPGDRRAHRPAAGAGDYGRLLARARVVLRRPGAARRGGGGRAGAAARPAAAGRQPGRAGGGGGGERRGGAGGHGHPAAGLGLHRGDRRRRGRGDGAAGGARPAAPA